MKLEDGFDSNYRYVLVAARRARQLQNGSQPLVPSRSTKACRVAQDEIAAGKVKFVQPARSVESNVVLDPDYSPDLTS